VKSAAAPARAPVSIEVRYAETDQMGVVHHANYLVWFELARTALCHQTGYHYADIEKMGYLLMVSGAELRYLHGARYGDRVEVSCRLERFASRGLRFRYEVNRGGELLATGATDHIWVQAATRRPCRIPTLLDAPFRQLAG
jgi:acyl-CoA thioester hydrolase